MGTNAVLSAMQCFSTPESRMKATFKSRVFKKSRDVSKRCGGKATTKS